MGTSGAAVVTLELDRADLADPDRVVKGLDAALGAADGTVRFALLDHITSPTAVTLPVARMVAVCKRHGVKVMVDGAHAPGNVPGLYGNFDIILGPFLAHFQPPSPTLESDALYWLPMLIWC